MLNLCWVTVIVLHLCCKELEKRGLEAGFDFGNVLSDTVSLQILSEIGYINLR